VKRRRFLQTTVLTTASTLGLGAGVPVAAAAVAGEKPRVRQYRRLGRTALEISDISFGAGQVPSASLVLRAIDQGVNYFDTAPDYGQSERVIGEALGKLGQRDKVYIASKFCRPVGYEEGVSHLQLNATKADYKSAVEGSLQRLGTEYLDAVFVHAIGGVNNYERERERLLHEPMLAAFEELKQEGKARYLAVSSHGPYQMEQLLTDAVESGRFDFIMPAFNFLKFPKVPEVLRLAQAKGVGVVAMKTLAGARDAGVAASDVPFEQAAFKWVLKHQEVAGLIVTMKRVSDLDLFLPASGQAFTALDQQALDRYAALYGADYCRTGCSACEPACPLGVPIASILRFQMYFSDYGDQKRAMHEYAGLDRRAEVCEGCAAAPCVGACPFGLPVAAKLMAAHRDLGSRA
jgi:aryl-alcohol dehydrogenase-like predicted oxidoreductase